MSSQLGRNSYSYMTPKFLERGDFTPPWMYEQVNQKEDLYIDSFGNLRSWLGATEEDQLHDNFKHQQFLRHRKNASFYQDEYNYLLSQMNNMIPANESNHALDRLLFLSQLADEALYEYNQNLSPGSESSWSKKPSLLNIYDMLSWKRHQDRKHEQFMFENQMLTDSDTELSIKHMKNKNFAERMIPNANLKLSVKTQGKKAVIESGEQRVEKDQHEKKPDCWHFMRGHCKRGKFCDFNHDSKHSYPDACKVFLGGLPFNITEATLRKQLLQQGFNVVNNPKIYGGFSPQVCLASAAEATRLIKKGPIMIGGTSVDVRSYQPFTKKNKAKLIDMSVRSVFLGGLRKGTTTQMIKRKLETLGVKIVNYPLIKAGFSPQVTLSTAMQALKLVNMAKVQINGALVDIRPYAGVSEMA